MDLATKRSVIRITDHVTTDQHKSAMMLLRRDQAKDRNEPITAYRGVARGEASRAISQN